ncbi:hypothetical protein GMRT_15497 [Giardia muris]|uniref:Uncharacterized protein n=1 Tax=Giardia muris TaxID=5742 RepID=A0A4Z1SVB1_GIAMU|nr:hypothetical protein GMRT_15497 [Giardia muris]|eukprot:TNJ29822.1 hypothetical protein GMRT_15497 [Giardia muris]
MLDGASSFILTSDLVAALSADHSEVILLAHVGGALRHVGGFPGHHYTQIQLIQTAEEAPLTLSFVANGELLVIITACGGIQQVITHETLGMALSDCAAVYRLAADRFLLVTPEELLELNSSTLDVRNFREPRDPGCNTQILCGGEPTATSVEATHLCPRILALGAYLYLLTVVRHDLYTLKIYSLHTHSCHTIVYLAARVVSLQMDVMGTGGVLLVADDGEIWRVFEVDGVFSCVPVSCETYPLRQPLCDAVFGPQVACLKTESFLVYVFHVEFTSAGLVYHRLVWTNDASFSIVVSLKPDDTPLPPNAFLHFLSCVTRKYSSHVDPQQTNSGSMAASKVITDVISSALPARPSKVLNVVDVSFNALQSTVLLQCEQNTFAICDLNALRSEQSFLQFIPPAQLVFAETIRLVLDCEQPIETYYDIVIEGGQDGGTFLLALYNLASGSKFSFNFVSQPLMRLLGSSEPFQTYSILSVKSFLICILSAQEHCLVFVISMRLHEMRHIDIRRSAPILFVYPLARFEEESTNNGADVHLTLYFLEMAEECTHSDSSTVFTCHLTTESVLIREAENLFFNVHQVSRISRLSLSFNTTLQAPSSLSHIVFSPYLILSDSTFILILATTHETYFYMCICDYERNATEMTLLELETALGLLFDAHIYHPSAGYYLPQTFQLRYFTDYLLRGMAYRSIDLTDSGGYQHATEMSFPSMRGKSRMGWRNDTQNGEKLLKTNKETILALNTQVERYVLRTHFDPYPSISGDRWRKHICPSLFTSVDHEFEHENEGHIPPVSDPLFVYNALLGRGGGWGKRDLASRVLNITLRKLGHQNGDNDPHRSSTVPMRLGSFLVSICSHSTKLVINFREDVAWLEALLQESREASKLEGRGGIYEPFICPKLDVELDPPVQFLWKADQLDVLSYIRIHGLSTIPSISTLLLAVESPLGVDALSSASCSSQGTLDSESNDMSYISSSHDEDRSSEVPDLPLTSLLRFFALDSSYRLTSSEFFEAYAGLQRLLVFVLHDQFKYYVNHLLRAIARNSGTFEQLFRDLTRYNRSGLLMNFRHSFGYYVSALINRCEADTRQTRTQPDVWIVTQGLTCLTAILVITFVQHFIPRSDAAAVFLKLQQTVAGILGGYPVRSKMLSATFVFAFLHIPSEHTRFAGVAYAGLLQHSIGELQRKAAEFIEKSIMGTNQDYEPSGQCAEYLDALLLQLQEVGRLAALNVNLERASALGVEDLLTTSNELCGKASLILALYAPLYSLLTGVLIDPANLRDDEEHNAPPYIILRLLYRLVTASTDLLQQMHCELAFVSLQRLTTSVRSSYLLDVAHLHRVTCMHLHELAVGVEGEALAFCCLRLISVQVLVGHESVANECAQRVFEYYFRSAEMAFDRHLYTSFIELAPDEPRQAILLVRSFLFFVLWIHRFRPGIWELEAHRLLQVLLHISQWFPRDRPGPDVEVLRWTVFEGEGCFFSEFDLAMTLAERIFDTSYGRPAFAVLRRAGGELIALHGFQPGLLVLCPLSSHSKEIYLQLCGPDTIYANPELALSSVEDAARIPELTARVYEERATILPCVSFISASPSADLVVVYCHNYRLLHVYRLSFGADPTCTLVGSIDVAEDVETLLNMDVGMCSEILEVRTLSRTRLRETRIRRRIRTSPRSFSTPERLFSGEESVVTPQIEDACYKTPESLAAQVVWHPQKDLPRQAMSCSVLFYLDSRVGDAHVWRSSLGVARKQSVHKARFEGEVVGRPLEGDSDRRPGYTLTTRRAMRGSLLVVELILRRRHLS